MRARGLMLALALVPIACAGSGGNAIRPQGPRTSADDSDLWNLAPSDVDALAEVDLTALRGSPWSQTLMQGNLEGDRDERRRRFGYDVFTEAERMLVASGEAAGGPNGLTIARGRFDATRVATAFRTSTPGAAETQWRQTAVWEGEGRAVALVTPRTLAHGDGQRVRAAVDAAWGVLPDADAGPLGELRRSLDADRSPPAVTLAISVTDAMRARAAGFLVVPEGLRRMGARLDLGADLNAEAVALFDSNQQAAAAALLWNDTARVTARQQMIVLLGLGPLFDGLTIGAEGSRVHAHLHLGADKREALAEKILALLQLVAKTRR
jgi:hypothetical protein